MAAPTLAVWVAALLVLPAVNAVPIAPLTRDERSNKKGKAAQAVVTPDGNMLIRKADGTLRAVPQTPEAETKGAELQESEMESSLTKASGCNWGCLADCMKVCQKCDPCGTKQWNSLKSCCKDAMGNQAAKCGCKNHEVYGVGKCCADSKCGNGSRRRDCAGRGARRRSVSSSGSSSRRRSSRRRRKSLLQTEGDDDDDDDDEEEEDLEEQPLNTSEIEQRAAATGGEMSELDGTVAGKCS